MKYLFLLFSICLLFSCKQSTKDDRTKYFPVSIEPVKNIPSREHVWVFILAGQSNMAGRGLVEPDDTLSDNRIFSIDSSGQLVYAKEPLHFYEPKLKGLDCGLSFGKTLLKNIPDSISLLIIPTAIGGSSSSQWLGDSLYRGVKLLSNFREKVETGKKYGEIKAILWHQGEADAHEKDIPKYEGRLTDLFKLFRAEVGNDSLPILLGELGNFPKDKANRDRINEIIQNYSTKDNHSAVIITNDLEHRGDSLHFNSSGQRMMGQRFAREFIRKFMP